MMTRGILFLIAFFVFLALPPAYAQNEITFIYLNGSNTNTEESKEDFIKGVNKLHKEIVKQFTADELITKQYLKNGEFTMNKTPKAFYWGDMSREELKIINEEFNILKGLHRRSLVAYFYHSCQW